MPAEPMVGTEFAGYRLNAVISPTNMSVVSTAEHPRLGHAVALKVLAPDLASNDRFRERLVSESRMAAGIRHPNVIPIYDAGPSDGLLYIAMLYVCYNPAPAPLMVWTHMRNNGELQPDHHDTLVVATTSNTGTLPSDLRDFWRYVGTLRTPIGKSLDSSDLPPLQA